MPHPSSEHYRRVLSVDSRLRATRHRSESTAHNNGPRAGNLFTQIPTLFAPVFIYNPLGIPEFDPIDLIDRENSAYVKTRGVSERFD